MSEFHRNAKSKDGHSRRCKLCQKEASAIHYLNNKEKFAERQRQAFRDNPDRMRDIHKRSYEKHKEARLQYFKQWRENNRALRKHYKEQRLEAEANRTPSWANMERMNGIYKLAKYLSRKYGRDIHVDHEIPLRGALVSGLHVEDNLQLMYAEDNLSKSNRYEVN